MNKDNGQHTVRKTRFQEHSTNYSVTREKQKSTALKIGTIKHDPTFASPSSTSVMIGYAEVLDWSSRDEANSKSAATVEYLFKAVILH
jgi:hypothetical protein